MKWANNIVVDRAACAVLAVTGMVHMAVAGEIGSNGDRGRTDLVLHGGWTADGMPVEIPHCWNVDDACDGKGVPEGWEGSSSVDCPSYERKSETDLRKKTGVTVICIRRPAANPKKPRELLIPTPTEKILAGDRLIVFGSMKQIDGLTFER